MIASISQSRDITREQLSQLLSTDDTALLQQLYQAAYRTKTEHYGNGIFVRGLIEVSNHCKNDCLYCGIRRSKRGVDRYRLTPEQVLQCCQQGYALGFRTFVLQGGEDAYFTDDRLVATISAIRQQYPDCAITLSLGERSRESYALLRQAGADRYLLRHETADAAHYAHLHPAEMHFDNRMRCLQDLKELGYQVGCGFMVGSPGQTLDTLYKDLQFIRRLQPAMVGIGPFIPASGTPFEHESAGSVDRTVRLLAIIRLIHPRVLLPATTALGTLHPQGREMGIRAGANVIMPNLSPLDLRAQYSIYDNKLGTGSEAAESMRQITQSLQTLGCQVLVDRGDSKVN